MNNVSFKIEEGTTFGLVGESGSGKSTIARALVNIYEVHTGSIHFSGVNLQSLKKKARPYYDQMQMIFQDPFSSLNERMRVKNIISEPIRYSKRQLTSKQLEKTVDELLRCVGLPVSSKNKFPHQFSGGQRQRISIARVLASQPRLLICDEPTSALDVSTQARILNLLKDLQQEFNLTMLFISHDLPVIYQMCDKVAVMKNGKIIEIQEADNLFNDPKNPYTKNLIRLIPAISSKYK